jgi:hypothetical protein
MEVDWDWDVASAGVVAGAAESAGARVWDSACDRAGPGAGIVTGAGVVAGAVAWAGSATGDVAPLAGVGIVGSGVAAGALGARPHAESTAETGAVAGAVPSDAEVKVAEATGAEATFSEDAGAEATGDSAAGASRLVGAFGFGSELAELLPPATATIWQSMPMVLWIAWRRFSEWSARPNAPARPPVVKASVSTCPSNCATWALGSTSAHVLRLILVSVWRTSGHARRRASTSPLPPAAGTGAAAGCCVEADACCAAGAGCAEAGWACGASCEGVGEAAGTGSGCWVGVWPG